MHWYLLDSVPVTEKQLLEEADKLLPNSRDYLMTAVPQTKAERAFDMFKANGHDIERLDDERCPAECPWPERLPN